MKHDSLADMFSILKNMEFIGRKSTVVPSTKLIENVLKIMNENGYIGDYKINEDKKFNVKLIGKINSCNVVKPRFSVKSSEFIKWEKRFLPAVGTGILILSTTKGVIDHKKAAKDGIGGQILGYVYWGVLNGSKQKN